MCGRYTLTVDATEVVRTFGIRSMPPDLGYLPPIFGRYNIAPTQPVAVILPGHRLSAIRWGLIPQWMRPTPTGGVPAGWFNAPADALPDRPAFRGAFQYRRCLVPATGFIAWSQAGKRKQPHHFEGTDRQLLAFAGIWETWCPPDGSELDTVALVTGPTDPGDAVVAPITDHQPLLLPPLHWDRWLTTPPDRAHQLTALLWTTADVPLQRTAIASRINRARHDDAACLEPMIDG